MAVSWLLILGVIVVVAGLVAVFLYAGKK